MKLLKKLLILSPTLLISLFIFPINNTAFAAWNWDNIDVDYYIIPKIEDESLEKIQEKTKEIWMSWWHVMDTYRDVAKTLTTAECLSSWIMTRDCVMNYLVFVIKFLSQLWLIIWTGFIIFAGYKYMINVFGWNTINKWMVTNAIIWIIIIIFSYAIMKTLTSIVWLS